MIEDKIYHIMIKINQLMSQHEHVKYIIPLFYNAIKIIYENCTHYYLQPNLIEQVKSKYHNVISSKQKEINVLTQIHYFMIEECQEMLQSNHVKAIYSKPKSQIFVRNNDSYLNLEQNIFLTQEIYHLDEEYKVISTQQSQNNQYKKIKISKPLSLDSALNSKQKGQNSDSIWQKIQKLYQEHKLDEAYFLVQKYQNNLFLYGSNSKISQSKEKMMAKIDDQYKTMKNFYAFFDQPGYIFDKKQNGISLYYKISQEQNDVSVRAQAEISISIENFLCIVAEIDLFSEYMPFTYDTKQLKVLKRNQKLGRTLIYIPLINNRQGYFVATAYDRLKTPHKSIFVFSKTITSDIQYQKKINFKVQNHPDFVELQYKFYNLEYIPLNNHRCKIRLAANIDLKLSFLPQFLINKSVRTFAFDFFQNIVKINQKFKGSLWQTKMKENPQFYNYFKERIRQYYQQNNN